MISRCRALAIIVLLLGVASLAIGGVFIFQGFAQSNMITEAMQLEKATHNADEIDGVIDTPQEAQAMASVLREHRMDLGIYTELDRKDPKRTTILKAMTMENALNLAQLGFGVTTVVKVTGVFMIIMGLALGATTVSVLRLDQANSRGG